MRKFLLLQAMLLGSLLRVMTGITYYSVKTRNGDGKYTEHELNRDDNKSLAIFILQLPAGEHVVEIDRKCD